MNDKPGLTEEEFERDRDKFTERAIILSEGKSLEVSDFPMHN